MGEIMHEGYKVVLYKTRKSFKTEGFTESFNVYETEACDLYVYLYDKDSDGLVVHDSERVRPILWNDEPCKSQKIHNDSDLRQDSISLGRKTKHFVLVEMELSDFREQIGENPELAIAQLVITVKELRVELNQCKITARNADTSAKENRNDFIRIKRYIGDFWGRYSALLSVLQSVFNRKKWKNRVEEAEPTFFEPVDAADLFDDDDIPF